MDGRRTTLLSLVAAALAHVLACAPAAAQDFYKDKTITLSIGSGVGGGFDIYARTVAQFLGKHIPGNPVIKPVNRPGAGGRSNGNLLYVRDPKDGTHIGLMGPWLVTEPMFGVPGVEFDPTGFQWLMSTARDVSACMFWKRSGIKTFADLKAKPEVTVGASGSTAITATDAYVLNTLFGTKIKVILGFKGTAEGVMAAERGELDGHCGMWISTVTSRYMQPINSGDATVVVQLGTWRHPQFPNAAHILELNPSADDLATLKLVYAQLDMARPFAAPPGVPADRVAILRNAFEQLMKDKDFLAEAEKRGLEVAGVSGAEIQKQIADMYATPKPIIERAKKLMGY